MLGKALLLILSGHFALVAHSPELSIEFLNQRGYTISQPELGVPFYLHAKVRGSQSHDRVELPSNLVGMNFNYLGTTRSITQINGQADQVTVYRFLGYANQTGAFQLSPIRLWFEQDLLGTYSVDLQIVERSHRFQAHNLPYARLQTGKEQFYIGESFQLKLKFYYRDQVSQPQIIIAPKVIEQFDLEPISSPSFGFEVIDGQKLNFGEWNLCMSAKQSGTLTILPIEVVFQQIDRSGMTLFFKTFSQQKIFSNGLNLEILPLPPTKLSVDGIGKFDSFEAHLDRTKINQAQAAQLKLNLAGKGNWSKLKIPKLKLPEELKSYAGKVEINDEIGTFDYVLQGLKAGKFEIPAQRFTFFDVETRQYRVLMTKALEIDVLPSSGSTSVEPPQLSEASSLESSLTQIDLEQFGIKPLCKDTAGVARFGRKYLPINWTIGLVGIALGLLLIGHLAIRRKKSLKICFANSLNEHISAIEIYDLLLKIFSQKFNVKSMHSKVVDERLNQLGVTIEQRLKFWQFFNDLQAAAFGNADFANLLERSRQWVVFLERLKI